MNPFTCRHCTATRHTPCASFAPCATQHQEERNWHPTNSPAASTPSPDEHETENSPNQNSNT